MKKTLAVEFVVYGIVLAVLSGVAYRAVPDKGLMIVVAGMVGGVVACVWGARSLWGCPSRWWLILSMAAVMYVMLSQAIVAWGDWGTADRGVRAVALITTLLLVFSLGMMMNLLHGEGREEGEREQGKVGGHGRTGP